MQKTLDHECLPCLPVNGMEKIVLEVENGSRFAFSGRLFSEAVWEDEDSGVLTHHKLYVTDQYNHVYVVVKSAGGKSVVHAFRAAVKGDRCILFDGRQTMELPVSMLLYAARSLCGIGAEALEQAEETLLSAGS